MHFSRQIPALLDHRPSAGLALHVPGEEMDLSVAFTWHPPTRYRLPGVSPPFLRVAVMSVIFGMGPL